MSEHPILPSALLSGSHAQFLEQLSDKEFWGYAVELAQRASVPEARLEEFLECKRGDDRQGGFLLPLGILREVLSPPHQFSLLPASPYWMLGVMAWRDEIIAVVDLDAFCSGPGTQPHADGMVVVAHVNDLLVGLFVASVGSMTTIKAEQMVPLAQVPDYDTAIDTRVAGAVKGVYADALVLDIPVILADIVEQIRMTAFYER